MFWAIEAGRVDTRGLEFEQVVSDIQTLNEWATEGRLEVTAISMGAYPHVADRYVLLPHGASMGFGYGPVVVAREPLDLDGAPRARDRDPRAAHDRVPRAPARARRGRCACASCRSTEILDEVDLRPRRRRARDPRGPAHLRRRRACTRCSTSASGGRRETGLPLPLGVNAARRDLGERLADVSAVLSEAIRAGLDHRDEALAYAERFGRGIDRATTDRFVAMYVNELTCDYGDVGRRAVDELLRRVGLGRHRKPTHDARGRSTGSRSCTRSAPTRIGGSPEEDAAHALVARLAARGRARGRGRRGRQHLRPPRRRPRLGGLAPRLRPERRPLRRRARSRRRDRGGRAHRRAARGRRVPRRGARLTAAAAPRVAAGGLPEAYRRAARRAGPGARALGRAARDRDGDRRAGPGRGRLRGPRRPRGHDADGRPRRRARRARPRFVLHVRDAGRGPGPSRPSAGSRSSRAPTTSSRRA